MQTEKQTITGILKDKITRHLAAHRAGQLARQAAELAAGGLFGAIVVSPDQVFNFLFETLKTQDFAPIKFCGVFFLFYFRKNIIRAIRSFRRDQAIKKMVQEREHLLDNIPAIELVDYLMRNRHFRREGVNGVRTTFGLTMERFNALAQKLESNGVLVRGPNNGRILADHWTRQTLFDYLSGNAKSADMMPRFTITRIGSGGKVRMDKNQLPVLS